MAKKLVVIENNQAITTSLKVAEAFDKQHFNVVRDIRELIKQMASASQQSKLNSAKMFVESSYQAEAGGRRYPMYLINRDGFSLLAMGFTGKKALQFKLKFINAFNKMEAQLAALTPEEIQRRKIRQDGKTQRNLLTAAIKPFVDREQPADAGIYYAAPTKYIQTTLCGIPKGGRDAAQGQQLIMCAAMELAGANAFNRADEHGQNYAQAFRNARTSAAYIKRIFDGEVLQLH